MNMKIKSLITVGAAAAVNCRPYLEQLVPQCVRTGASKDDIRKAIETGFQANRGAHAKTQGYVDALLMDAGESNDGLTRQCRSEETGAQNGCC